MKTCPRCGKTHYNTITITRYTYKMPVNKCVICGFLWIFDEDLKGLAKAESKKMFIEALRNMGKTIGEDKRKNGS
jgi:transcription elongation factor Elf1